VRIQPGPSSKTVTPHNDAEYGHQKGELNFWLPLTHYSETKTTLFAEENVGKEDYVQFDLTVGEIGAFHGTSARHYVPNNPTSSTRVSIDFRIGVEGFYDSKWSMKGTSAEHTRRIIKY